MAALARQGSRARAAGMHAIGDDEVQTEAAAPTPQEMARGGLSVQPLTLELAEALGRIHDEGFATKAMCMCLPLKDAGALKRYYARHPERLPLCGVVLGEDGTPLGFVSLAVHPMGDRLGLHTLKPGEAYIEQIGVAAAARGKGVGTLLLQWAEQWAREHSATLLTLSVLNGNPARRLYERFGFAAVPKADPIETCIEGGVVCCCFGRPYGLCDPHCGAADMKKPLA